MPCNSDYMNATLSEKNLSRVRCLLDEVKTGKPVDPNSSDWQGYRKGVYNESHDHTVLNREVRKLCKLLSEISDTSKYSLELQMWWRDHQAADKKRLAKEKAEKEEKALAESAKKKLTKAELAALKKRGL